MEKRVAELDREFHDKIEVEIEQGLKEEARSKLFVSPAEKQFVSDIADEL
ncbi:hypothetical protein [Rossellomorea marisflavi]